MMDGGCERMRREEKRREVFVGEGASGGRFLFVWNDSFTQEMADGEDGGGRTRTRRRSGGRDV